jgi:hypothetical protein
MEKKVCKKCYKRYAFWLSIIIIVLLGFGGIIYEEYQKNSYVLPSSTVNQDEVPTIKFLEDGTPYVIHPDKILSGGPPKDGIPSIDTPKFVSVQEADKWIADNELVLALIYNNEIRVYPHQIMVWHEIVNDEVAETPLLISYCPLCGSGIAYLPEIEVDGEKVITEFGTSGKLFNSNLVMYDRLTDTYWTQINGEAIVGELTGQKLEKIPLHTVIWSEWIEEHPESLVLSQDTGFEREYGVDPYGSYYADERLFFPIENTNDFLHPKDVIYGLEINNEYKAYREESLEKESVYSDTLGGVDISIQRKKSGEVIIINKLSQEQLAYERDFWFSWYAFNPNTTVFGVEGRQE